VRSGDLKRLIFFLSVFAVAVTLWSASVIAESATTPARSVAPKTDEARVFIEQQRAYVYKTHQRDIFRNIFADVVPMPTRVKRTPGPKDTPEPVATKDLKALMKMRAETEGEQLQKVLDAHMKKREFELVISKAREFFEQYKDLGADAQPIFAPITAIVVEAQEKQAQITSFRNIASSVKILSIVWGERTRSAVINGVYVMKGDNIASLFGSNAPKDLKIVDIRPDRIILGSEELGLTEEVLFDPSVAK
jgi:hypothetical protein